MNSDHGFFKPSKINLEKEFLIANEVFENLKATKGLFPSQAPKLKLVRKLPDSNFAMAMIRGDSVFLELQSYRICQSFGKDSLDALAFLLGHELAHFSRKHDERFHFKKKNAFSRSEAIEKSLGNAAEGFVDKN